MLENVLGNLRRFEESRGLSVALWGPLLSNSGFGPQFELTAQRKKVLVPTLHGKSRYLRRPEFQAKTTLKPSLRRVQGGEESQRSEREMIFDAKHKKSSQAIQSLRRRWSCYPDFPEGTRKAAGFPSRSVNLFLSNSGFGPQFELTAQRKKALVPTLRGKSRYLRRPEFQAKTTLKPSHRRVQGGEASQRSEREMIFDAKHKKSSQAIQSLRRRWSCYPDFPNGTRKAKGFPSRSGDLFLSKYRMRSPSSI